MGARPGCTLTPSGALPPPSALYLCRALLFMTLALTPTMPSVLFSSYCLACLDALMHDTSYPPVLPLRMPPCCGVAHPAAPCDMSSEGWCCEKRGTVLHHMGEQETAGHLPVVTVTLQRQRSLTGCD